jgi:TatD DNase family protein
MWVDSHCHLQLDARGEDTLADAARDAGVETMVCVGTDLESSRRAIEIAAARSDVFATVGLHPHDASRLAAEWDALVTLVPHERVVAIGEAGFDLHHEHSPRTAQEEAFRAQVRLARERDLPLVIHSREAWEDTFRVLEDEGVPECTVFHCFTGGPVEARHALELGAHVSFSGIVSFKGADDVRAAAAEAPEDRILVETDAPYLAPVPHRGRPNEPAYVPFVGAALAAARGAPLEWIAETTAANARRVFRLERSSVGE